MSNLNMDGLPVEMQQRISQIVQGAQQKAVAAQPQQPAAPIAKQPSLMDHTIALRQEVAALRQEVNAIGQVTEAVGNAVGQLYAMFQQQTEVTDYSTTFQAQQPVDEDY